MNTVFAPLSATQSLSLLSGLPTIASNIDGSFLTPDHSFFEVASERNPSLFEPHLAEALVRRANRFCLAAEQHLILECSGVPLAFDVEGLSLARPLEEFRVKEVIRAVAPSVVSLFVTGQKEEGEAASWLGSGYVVSPQDLGFRVTSQRKATPSLKPIITWPMAGKK